MREEKESKIEMIFIITSTLKIECGFKLIVLKIFGKTPRPILDIKEKISNFQVCLCVVQWSRTMFCPFPFSKIRNDPDFVFYMIASFSAD